MKPWRERGSKELTSWKLVLRNSLSTTKVVLIGVWLVYRCAPDAVTVIEWVQLPYHTPMSITDQVIYNSSCLNF